MENDVGNPVRPFPSLSSPLYLSTGHTAHSEEHTGIQRVTRSLARELQASGLEVEFIEWVQSKYRYVVLDDHARQGLAREGGPTFESIDDLIDRVLPEAGRLRSHARASTDRSGARAPALSEDRIVRFEAIFRSIRHPVPAVPRLIDYLPAPRSVRRATRRAIRQVINRCVRWRDRYRIRHYIREVQALRRAHNRMTQQILKLSEKRRACEYRLLTMEKDAWRYKQDKDGLARAQAEAAGDQPALAPPHPAVEPEPNRRAADEAELFPLICRLEPTRFKPVRGSWVVVPELMRPREMKGIVRYCRRRRLKLAVIFHDAIAVTHPDLVSESIRRNHSGYMRHLCRANLVLAVSRQSADDLRQFALEHRINPPPIDVCANGASFPGERVVLTPPAPDPVRAVCVSTIDPRKNHRVLIDALDRINRKEPDLDLQVTLIGNAYPGADALVHRVNEACDRIPGLNWLQGVTDSELVEAYQQSHFSIFPSRIEGFGLPVLESLWHGRPCICARTGAPAESAAGGGCLTVDVTDSEALAEAIIALARDNALRRQLTDEAESRVLRTWRDQAIELLEHMDRGGSPGS